MSNGAFNFFNFDFIFAFNHDFYNSIHDFYDFNDYFIHEFPYFIHEIH
jgi:hypothetical protein